MNILIIDVEATNLELALRCAHAGHDVRWWRWSKPGARPIRDGEGFRELTIVDAWEPHMAWARDGLIAVTGNFVHMWNLDRAREEGYRVFGPTVQSARLEINRRAGMEAMQACGVDVPPFRLFDSLEECEAFARKSGRLHVFKPGGDESDKSLTFAGAKDPAELVGWLRRQIGRGKKLRGQALLQEKVEGVEAELGVSGWMGPEGFLPHRFQLAFEHKPLMDHDIGPNTGEQGTVCQYVESDKLATEMLLPMEPVLRNTGHSGDFAVNAIIDNRGRAWFLEFTARLGYPAWYIQQASHRGDPAKWMRDLVHGRDSLRVSYDTAIGVVLAQPRYPYGDSPAELVEGVPIMGVDDVRDDVHLVQVMRGKGPCWEGGRCVDRPQYETSGEYVAVATGLGKTVEQARRRVYRTVDAVRFPDRMFRSDIGEKLKRALPKLHGAGYAKDVRYD